MFGVQRSVKHPNPEVEHADALLQLRPDGQALRERITDNLHERITEDVSERLTPVIKERLESAQRERLGGAVRGALAEQIALGGGFDSDHIAEAVRDRIADHLCDVVTYAIRERLAEVIREHLTASVRNAVSQSMTRAETAAGVPTAGVH